MGDLYALLTAVCWSIAVILFDLSSNKFNSITEKAQKDTTLRKRIQNAMIRARLP